MKHYSVEKIIAAYKHFGSLRKAAARCGVSKDTVEAVVKRHGIAKPSASLSHEVPYHRVFHYSELAKWHAAHADDPGLPGNLTDFAKLAGVQFNTAKCYFYRRRVKARKLLGSLPVLKELDLPLEDIEGVKFSSRELLYYHFAIDRYAMKAALQGSCVALGEVTVLIPSIEVFAARVKKAAISVPEGRD